MLTRNTQVGEFYYMTPPRTFNAGKKGDDWQPHMCDMIIYDEEADKHVRISWKDAMSATCIDVNGKLGGAGTAFPLKTTDVPDMTSEDWYNICNAWNDWNEEGVIKADFTLTGLSPVTAETNPKAAFIALSSMPMPTIAIARPFIEHMMHSVILTVSGRDTGATLFGPADMSVAKPFTNRLRTVYDPLCASERVVCSCAGS